MCLLKRKTRQGNLSINKQVKSGCFQQQQQQLESCSFVRKMKFRKDMNGREIECGLPNA